MNDPQGGPAERDGRVLKRDVFGFVERVDLPHLPAVRRVARATLPGAGLVARILLRRERRGLRALAGCPGVPRLLDEPRLEVLADPAGRIPRRGTVLVRSWIEGVPLSAAAELPRDFFARLEELVQELHRRSVCHNDLHKEQNVIVGADGFPALVDFQLASVHRVRGRLFASRARDDLRHVEKHRRRYARRGVKSADATELPPRSALAALWRRVVKPVYARVRGARPGEPRRPSQGPWPEWTAPTGERPGRGDLRRETRGSS